MTRSMLWNDELFPKYMETRASPSKERKKQLEKKKRQSPSSDDLFDDGTYRHEENKQEKKA